MGAKAWLYPHLPIVIASGYCNDVLRERFKSDPNIRFIGKPYTQEDLRQILQTLPG